MSLCAIQHSMIRGVFFLLLCNNLLASTVSMLVNDVYYKETPANDLYYKNSPIDKSDALDLKRNGLDISKINPKESNLWINKKLSTDNYNSINYPGDQDLVSGVTFKNYKSSPTEFFRALVEDSKGNYWTLVASLENHTNILRASLLRLLGYHIDTPKFYKEIKINFSSNDERDKFLSNLGEATLSSRNRWIKSENDSSLTLKGLTLEPSKLSNVNIHMPLMTKERQRERRIFRSLLAIYLVTDFAQSVNSVEWTKGRVFNDSLLFNHPYADQFTHTTADDMRWILRRFNSISNSDLLKAFGHTGYPDDIKSLLVEKLKSRINSLRALLNLKKAFKVNKRINNGAVENGELVSGDHLNSYVVDFYQDDEESPYNFRQIFKLFKTQTIYSTLSSFLDHAVEKFVPGKRVNDAIGDIQERITSYKLDNPDSDIPISSYTEPVANGRIFGSRNVIFGQYLGSSAPIQLVDTVGGEVNLGSFSKITGFSNTVLPSVGISASLSRTYTHVRAMPDLETASSQSIKKILVSSHLKKLGRVINDEFNCSIPKDIYLEEEVISGRLVTIIKYDKNIIDGFKKAVIMRKKLEGDGSDGPFIIRPIDRDALCISNLSKMRKSNLKEFIDQFALNETFIINDSIRLSSSQNISVPISGVGTNTTVSIGGDQSVAMLSSTIIRKTSDGIEITFQSQKNIIGSFNQKLNYFIELISNSTQWTKGNLLSKVYKINLNELNDLEQEKALLTVRDSIVNNNHKRLKQNYDPTKLDHSIKTKLNTFRFLFLKSEKLKMNHEVKIIIPNKEKETFSEKERTRKLYSVSNYKRSGSDYYSFFDKILSYSNRFLSIGQSNQDPGRTFFGTSEKVYVTTEGELSQNYSLKPVTRVEYKWTGWNKDEEAMNEVFDEVEDLFDGIQSNIIDRSILHGSSNVKSYDVSTNFIIYPKAFDNIENNLFSQSEVSVINLLYLLYGERKWGRYCKRAKRFFGDSGPHNYRGEDNTFYSCIPYSVRRLLKIRRMSKVLDRKKVLIQRNNIIKYLFHDFKVPLILDILGKENFFATTRVSGFREDHHEGYLDYISDSVGRYDPSYGTGIFDTLAQFIGLNVFELRALMYTPGM